MGVPLKVACSEVAIAFGDAAAYLSALARVVRLVVLLLAAVAP